MFSSSKLINKFFSDSETFDCSFGKNSISDEFEINEDSFIKFNKKKVVLSIL